MLLASYSLAIGSVVKCIALLQFACLERSRTSNRDLNWNNVDIYCLYSSVNQKKSFFVSREGMSSAIIIIVIIYNVGVHCSVLLASDCHASGKFRDAMLKVHSSFSHHHPLFLLKLLCFFLVGNCGFFYMADSQKEPFEEFLCRCSLSSILQLTLQLCFYWELNIIHFAKLSSNFILLQFLGQSMGIRNISKDTKAQLKKIQQIVFLLPVPVSARKILLGELLRVLELGCILENKFLTC